MEADDNALLGLLSLKRISIGPFIGGQHIDYRLSNKSGGRIFDSKMALVLWFLAYKKTST